jgi:hypothetical protein
MSSLTSSPAQNAGSAVKVSSVDVHAEYLDQLVDGRPVGASA